MNLKSQLESILFVHGEPIGVARLVKITGAKRAEVESALEELAGEYRERGIILIKNGEEWQLATHPASKHVVEGLVTSELAEELSRAGLEVLSIIAYRGPASRAAIEHIRGVDSSYTLRNLLLRGLVERSENPADRRSYLYRISADFLKHLGLARAEELPRFKEFKAASVEPFSSAKATEDKPPVPAAPEASAQP